MPCWRAWRYGVVLQGICDAAVDGADAPYLDVGLDLKRYALVDALRQMRTVPEPNGQDGLGC